MAGEWDLPTVHRKPRGDDAASPNVDDYERRPMLSQDERDNAERRKKRRNATSSFFSGRRLVAFVAVAGFLLGYYAQLLVFFLHVRVGFTGEILPTREVSLAAKFTRELVEDTKRVTFVSKKTNWDFLGLVASPHTVIFAHEDVHIPKPFDETLSIVRHSGVDSYMNLHNKTLTIMSHVHRSGSQFHFFKQDDEAVMYWPHYYQCMNQCKNLGTCYAGDMHVNIGDATNSNSYVFATGGSYFIGNELLKCILDNPVYVRLDGLDFGEDKTVGKMIHYNKCDVQIVSCKWFNNKEIYSPNAVVRMIKGATTRYIVEDTELLSQAQQEEKKKVEAAQEP